MHITVEIYLSGYQKKAFQHIGLRKILFSNGSYTSMCNFYSLQCWTSYPLNCLQSSPMKKSLLITSITIVSNTRDRLRDNI